MQAEKTQNSGPLITEAQLVEAYLPPQMESYFQKKLGEHFSNDEIRVQIVELLKALTLYHNCRGGIPFSEEIDEVWHFWILQTQQYEELCQKLPGKKFLHHSAFDYGGEAIPAHEPAELDRLLSFFASYVLNFGPIRESVLKYWPKGELIKEAMELSLDDFNDYLRSLAT